jgi:TPR repeat protein
MYERGEGVEKDVKKAFRWYRKAADQGDEDALAILRNSGGSTAKQ